MTATGNSVGRHGARGANGPSHAATHTFGAQQGQQQQHAYPAATIPSSHASDARPLPKTVKDLRKLLMDVLREHVNLMRAEVCGLAHAMFVFPR